MNRINAEKAERLLIDWFVWDARTRLLIGDDPPHRGPFPGAMMDQIKDEWINCADPEWLPIFVEIATHPPDLKMDTQWRFDYTSGSWNPDEEFYISLEYILSIWLKYRTELWMNYMTPFLKNEIDVSANPYVSSSREMALRVMSQTRSFYPGVERDLCHWLEPVANNWQGLNELEKSTFIGALQKVDLSSAEGMRLLNKLLLVVEPKYLSEIEFLLS